MTERTRVERETGGVFRPLTAVERDKLVSDFEISLRQSGLVVDEKVEANAQDVKNVLRALLGNYVKEKT